MSFDDIIIDEGINHTIDGSIGFIDDGCHFLDMVFIDWGGEAQLIFIVVVGYVDSNKQVIDGRYFFKPFSVVFGVDWHEEDVVTGDYVLFGSDDFSCFDVNVLCKYVSMFHEGKYI